MATLSGLTPRKLLPWIFIGRTDIAAEIYIDDKSHWVLKQPKEQVAGLGFHSFGDLYIVISA